MGGRWCRVGALHSTSNEGGVYERTRGHGPFTVESTLVLPEGVFYHFTIATQGWFKTTSRKETMKSWIALTSTHTEFCRYKYNIWTANDSTNKRLLSTLHLHEGEETTELDPSSSALIQIICDCFRHHLEEDSLFPANSIDFR